MVDRGYRWLIRGPLRAGWKVSMVMCVCLPSYSGYLSGPHLRYCMSLQNPHWGMAVSYVMWVSGFSLNFVEIKVANAGQKVWHVQRTQFVRVSLECRAKSETVTVLLFAYQHEGRLRSEKLKDKRSQSLMEKREDENDDGKKGFPM